MIRIAISRAAFEAIAAMMPLGRPLQQKTQVVLRIGLSYTSGQRG
jgi:hypothetical protein